MILASPSRARRGGGDVKVVVGASGRNVIVNENRCSVRAGCRRARRAAGHRSGAADRPPQRRQNLDPKLVRAVIQAESGYNAGRCPNKGAMGLMQLMPATASLLNVTTPSIADENIRGGTTLPALA